jgi:hypothetical protein
MESGFRKKTALAFGVVFLASLLYYCYSNEQVREIDSNQGERQLVFELHFFVEEIMRLRDGPSLTTTALSSGFPFFFEKLVF